MDYNLDAMLGYSAAFIGLVVLLAGWLFGRT